MNIFQWSTVNFESGGHLLLLRHCGYKTLLTVGVVYNFYINSKSVYSIAKFICSI